MYALELAFSDDPARLEGRPAHREQLTALREAGRLLAAGPYADESGALLLFGSTPRPRPTRSSPPTPTTPARA